MAIKNLRCTREGDSIAVVWIWDAGQDEALITVTGLLDGNEMASKKIQRDYYRQAVNTPQHGPILKVPPVPLRITVKDGDSKESFDLIDKSYTVEWRLRKQPIYQRHGFFGGHQELVRTDVWLQLKFPYEGRVPDDLFYYVLTAPGEQPEKALPAGCFPGLHPGINEYGVIPPTGRMIQLLCNPNHQEASRLFQFRRLPDAQQ